MKGAVKMQKVWQEVIFTSNSFTSEDTVWQVKHWRGSLAVVAEKENPLLLKPPSPQLLMYSTSTNCGLSASICCHFYIDEEKDSKKWCCFNQSFSLD